MESAKRLELATKLSEFGKEFEEEGAMDASEIVYAVSSAILIGAEKQTLQLLLPLQIAFDKTVTSMKKE